MSESGYTLFETSLGACGIAWGPAGLLGMQLPEANEARALVRLRRRFPELIKAPPPLWVEAIIRAVRAALAGEPADLAPAPLDTSGLNDFDRAVYRLAQDIPRGETITYGTMAERLGDPGLARAVGRALGRNPWPIVVPCHRITGADGRTGGFSAPGGIATKLKLLEIEGALRAESLPLFATLP